MFPSNAVLVSPTNQYGPVAEYGQRQAAFEQASKRIVGVATKQIKDALASTSSSAPLFYQLLTQFAKERRRLALEAGTQEAGNFGLFTARSNGEFHPNTPLVGHYVPANASLLSQLRDRTQSIPFNGLTFSTTAIKTTETVLGRQFSCETQIFDAATMLRKATPIPEDGPITRQIVPLLHIAAELKRLHATVYAQVEAAAQAKKANAGVSDLVDELKKSHPKMYSQLMTDLAQAKELNVTIFDIDGELKKSHPETYLRNRFHAPVSHLEKICPTDDRDPKYAVNSKAHYVLSTMRTQIGNQMVATSQWLTWLPKPSEGEDPREQLQKEGPQPVVAHMPQDVFLHEKTLKECARLFDQAVHWNRETSTVDELKDKVALFRHLFAQVSPYVRGSAAAGGWYEQAIYDAFDAPCSYHKAHPTDSVDLVAISKLSVADYLHRYRTLVRVPGDTQGEKSVETPEGKKE